ncbi:uncharacterized protein LOC121871477 [Homarus americanus]|uniref:uncharacterized protein LOC121871477 n=1 Tax=Homarus americanus TaxID=6706 RepID=UPI001C44C2C5|nr:uncharacterized protein LOC121871477 [Homarus americanus]
MALMSVSNRGRWILSLLAILSFFGLGLARALCKRTIPGCVGNDCTEEIECFHGICDEDGNCECLPCYSGTSCSTYDDKYGPRFAIREDTVIINAQHQGVVYKAVAEDEDLGLTCPLGPGLNTRCPCATIHYTILDENKEVHDLFGIHDSSGLIYLKPDVKMEPGRQYHVEIIASSTKDSRGLPDHPMFDAQVLTVVVRRDDTLQDLLHQEALPDAVPLGNNIDHGTGASLINTYDDEEDEQYETEEEEDKKSLSDEKDYNDGGGIDNNNNYSESVDLMEPETLVRKKRAAAGPTDSVSTANLELNKLAGGTTTLQPGNSVDYEMKVALPNLVTAIDLIVEIFVMDAVSGITQFALCDVVIQSIGSGITDEAGAAIAPADFSTRYEYNPFFLTFYDRVIIDFGRIKNGDTYTSGTPPDDVSTIRITFTATLVKNDAYTNDSVIVTAGAEYDSEKWVWVSQETHSFDTTAVAHDQTVTMTSPSSIAQYAGGGFKIDVYMNDPFTTMLFEVYTPDGIHDKFSVSHIFISAMGSNYICMVDNSRKVTYHPSVSGRTFHRATIEAQIILRNLDYADLAAALTDPNFKIEFGFNIFILDAVAGESVAVGAGLVIGTNTVWTENVTVSVTAGVNPPTGGDPTWQSIVPLTSTEVADGGTVTWGVPAEITNAGSSFVECTVTPTAPHKACGVSYGTAGPNIVSFPPLTFTNNSDGSLVFSAYINSTGTFATANADLLVFEVSVQFNGAPSDTSISCTGGSGETLSVTTGTAGTADMQGTVDSVSSDVIWYDGSQAGLLITLTLPGGGVPYASMTLEAAGDLDITGWGSRACGARIITAGVGVPCIAGKIDLLNEGVSLMKGKADSVFTDGIRMELGPACGTIRTESLPDSAYQVKIAVYYEIPKLQASAAGGAFNISLGLSLSDSLIWTSWGSFTFNTGAPAYTAGEDPTFGINPIPEVIIDPGVPQMVKVVLKPRPGTVGHYIITFSVDDVTQISICRIFILEVGPSYPCLDKDPYFKEDLPYQHVTIIHDSVTWGLEAVLDLGVVRNLGTGDPYSSPIADDNTIVVGVLLKGVAGGTAGVLTASLSNSGTLTPSEASFTVTANVPNTGGAISLVAEAMDGTGGDSYDGVMKIIEFKLTVPADYRKEVIATITNTAVADITICLAALYSAGDNLPCLIQSEVISNKTESTETQEVMEVLLGTVCHYPISDNSTEDEAIIRVGAMFMQGGQSSATVTLELTEGGVAGASASFPMTKLAGPYNPGTINVTGMKLEPLTNSSAIVTPGSRAWHGVAFTIPRDVTTNIEFSGMTSTDGGRAYATIHGFRFSRETSGKNLGCLLDDCLLYKPNIIQNSSIIKQLIHESQTDTLSADLFYITNTGVSKKPVDDQLRIEVDVMIADHPNVTDQTEIKIYFAVKAGNTIFVVPVPVILSKTGAETLQIATQMFLTDNTTTMFNQGERVGVTVRTFHTNESQVEANNAKIRFLMPQYLSYEDGVDVCTGNISGNVSYQGYLDYEITNLFFTDILELNCTLTVDVNVTLPKGLGLVNATTLMRLVCSTNLDTTLKYCANTSYLRFEIDGSDCTDPLGLGTFTSCQITASSAIDVANGPDLVKPGSGAGWCPPVRPGSTWQHYLTLDFLKLTRVTKITFEEVAGMLSVKEFRLQYSHNGQLFTDACQSIIPVPTSGEVILPSECRIEARFGRIFILSVSNGLGTAAIEPGVTPIGVRFLDWYGCFLETTPDVCSTALTTLYSDNYKEWRHMAYDEANAIFYFCDVSLKDNNKGDNKAKVCFTTTDGSSWIALPKYIGSLVGYDATTKAMYAYDRKRTAMVKSIDGINWSIVADADHATITAAVVPPTPIPGKPSATLGVLTAGPWTADFDGLSLAGANKAKWANCCS